MIKQPLMKRSKGLYMFLVCFGVVLMAGGMVMEGFGFDSRFLGFGSGLGSAAIAVSSVFLILLRGKPEDARQREINEKDERNVKIREKSGYDTWFVTLFGLVAVEFAFLILDDMISCYIIMGLMAVHVFSFFMFLYRNGKRL